MRVKELHSESSLRLCTYNVNYGLAQNEIGLSERLVIKAIMDSRCDVVLLQETHSGWEDVLNSDEQLNARFPFRAFVDEGRSSPGGQSILSRVPFSKQEIVYSPAVVKGAWFPAWMALFSFPGNYDEKQEEEEGKGEEKTRERLVWIASVHLRPPLTDEGRATISSMKDTSPVRVQELTLLFEHLENVRDSAKEALVVAGDFNESCALSAVTLLRKRGLRDALAKTKSHTHWWPVFGPGQRGGGKRKRKKKTKTKTGGSNNNNNNNNNNEEEEGADVDVDEQGMMQEEEGAVVEEEEEEEEGNQRAGKNQSRRQLVLRSRLDHVFYDVKHLSCVYTKVLHEFEGNASDHLPVIAELEWSQEAQHRRAAAPPPFYTWFRLGWTALEKGTVWAAEDSSVD